MSFLIHGATQVVCLSNSRQKFKAGRQEMHDIALLESDEESGLSIVVDGGGKIEFVGRDVDAKKKYPTTAWKKILDVNGKCILPGFVDAHTHPVWDGDRVNEFAMKLSGATYLDIHKAGGGIHYTVEQTRKAGEDRLLQLLLQRLKRMSKTGTTTVECKSGYGLDVENEIKMLRVLERAKSKSNMTISSTFCGAHAVPREKSKKDYVKEVIEIQLPEVKKLKDNGELNVDSVDVFCEKGVFEVDDTEAILKKAKEAGFLINFHAEELNYIGGVEMGSSLQAEAMSHLEEISPEGISAMATSGSVAVILPTTAHILRLRPPPARDLIEAGIPVALGSDFNPNAHCSSMPLVMHLACVQMHMTMKEALVGATLNAAHSIRKSHEIGSLEVGKWADMVVLDSTRWENIVYQLGGESEIISHVIQKGNIVHQKP